MKILHLEAGTHLYGGALQVLLLVEGLMERGVENLLVVPPGSEVEREARTRGLPVRPLPLGGEADLTFPFRFRRLIRAETPDLVHLHSRRGADTLGALGARWAGVPLVLTRRVDNPEARWTIGPKYGLPHRIITISEAIRSVLEKEGVPVEKLRCVRSALDGAGREYPCGQEAFLQEFDLAEEDRVIGMAAQFIPRKGHRTLLDAVPSILREYPRARFLLFGRGPLEEEIAGSIKAEGLENEVRMAGFRPDLTDFLPCLDMLVHPATMEGLGIALLQASAAGIPIVAANAGGIPEAVHDGRTGLLIPPDDPSSLAAAVSALLSDPERARAMGEAGRELIGTEFTVDRMVEGNLQVYRELLTPGKSSPKGPPSP